MKVRIQAITLPAGSVFDSEPLPHPTSPRPRRWKYFNDFSDWAASGKIMASGCNPRQGCCASLFGCGTNLDGRLWVRSDTTKGTLGDPVSDPSNDGFAPKTTGLRWKNGAPSSQDVELSNHYVFLQPDGTFSSTRAYPVAEALPRAILYKVLPRPPIDPPGWDGMRGEEGYLVATQDGGFGLLRAGGVALLVTDQVGGHLRGLLKTPDLVWASAVEPRLVIANSAADKGFHALAFAADGTDVVGGVLRSGLFAGSTVDFDRAAPTRPGLIPPREGFTAVFSRSEDRAFVLGGRDASTGETLHDLWMRPVEGPGEWRRLNLDDFEVGSVLAATCSYLDHRLWMVDEVEVDSKEGMEARLYRVEPYLGAVQRVGAWRRDPARDKVFLVLDRDGAVLLVTSSTIRAEHSVVRLEAMPYAPWKPLRVSIKHWPGALAGAPFADTAGYSFALHGPLETVQLERRTYLGLLSGELSDVGSAL
jgi:hypothetical protein